MTHAFPTRRSSDLMVWLHIEDIRLVFPEFFDGLIGCLEAQCLQLLGKVVSDQPVADMAAQLVDRRVMERFDGGLLDGAHHPFGLTITEERRAGKGCVSKRRSWWASVNIKKKN